MMNTMLGWRRVCAPAKGAADINPRNSRLPNILKTPVGVRTRRSVRSPHVIVEFFCDLGVIGGNVACFANVVREVVELDRRVRSRTDSFPFSGTCGLHHRGEPQ